LGLAFGFLIAQAGIIFLMSIFTGKRILLGVSGSIAAYKAADLASKLAQGAAQVTVILTAGAEKFISALTFQSVTGQRAYTDADLWAGEAHVLHVGLARGADLFVIGPCTAHTMAKLAHGEADNLLTITALAAACPLLLAPAMDGGMWGHPATQANLRTLQERGVLLAGPVEGHLASGMSGAGRMLEPAELLGYVRLALGREGKLAGRRVVVTAGGTQEPVDPVRVLTNRSSGKQGFALAQAALDAGALVTLIATPTTSALALPVGARHIRVGTAREMLAAVLGEGLHADALLMAAAVADFSVAEAAPNKLKKREGLPEIKLVLAPDVLAAVAGASAEGSGPKVVVGFAAETRDLLENASEKLESKRLSFIAANDISTPDAGFGADTNRVTLLFADGRTEALPLMSKAEVAEAIIEHVATLLEA
jgi:phosphopantothenoylcysteine decarboxylase/phosphopantothenate--cysteine ligase